MKILVTTHKGQGKRASDFCCTMDGEPVLLPWVCDRDANARPPDAGCGCGRSFCGFNTLKGTTTAEVQEVETSAEQFIERYLLAQVRAGFLQKDASAEDRKEYIEGAREILRIADAFPVGAILEKRGARIQIRKEDNGGKQKVQRRFA